MGWTSQNQGLPASARTPQQSQRCAWMALPASLSCQTAASQVRHVQHLGWHLCHKALETAPAPVP